MSQRRINFLKNGSINSLKWWTGTFSDTARVQVATDILNEGIEDGDTIVDADMPISIFGSDLDWSTGTLNDYVVTITSGFYEIEQDMTEVSGTVTYTPKCGDYIDSQANSTNIYDEDFGYDYATDGWADQSAGLCNSIFSVDGNYLAIGARSANSYQGEILLLKWSGSAWSQVQKITTEGAAQLGTCIEIRGLYLVAGTEDNKIYIYKNNGSDEFSLIQTISGNTGEAIGSSTSSMDFDGTTLVVARYSYGGSGTEGRIIIFKRTNDTFARVQTIDGAIGDYIGYNVKVKGNYLAFSASNSPFKVYVYKNNGSDVWNLVKDISFVDYSARGLGILNFGGQYYIAFTIYGAGGPKLYMYKITNSDLEFVDLFEGSHQGGSDARIYCWENELALTDEYSNEQGTQSGSIKIYQIIEGRLQFSQSLMDSLSPPQSIQRFGVGASLSSNFLIVNSGIYKKDRIWVFPKTKTNYNVPLKSWDYTYYLNQQPGEVTSDQLGKGVAMYGEWSCALAPSANGGLGGLYIYKLNTGNDTWEFVQEVVGSSGSGFAYNPAVDMYNGYISVGAYNENYESVAGAGAIYVYKKGTGDSWSEVAVIQNSDAEAYDYLGSSEVSIYGSYIAASSLSNNGIVWLFKNNGSDSYTRVLKATGTVAGANFGASISLSGDYLAVSEPYGDSYNGLIHIYKNDGADNWTEVETIAVESGDRYLGLKVSMDGDYLVASYLISGAYGALKVYKNNGSDVFNRIAIIKNPINSEQNGYFGNPGLKINGDIIIAGVPSQYLQGFSAGAAFVFFRYLDDTWGNVMTIQNEDLGAPTRDEQFGYSVSIYNSHIMIGAYQDDPNNVSLEGAVHFYKAPDAPRTIPVQYVTLVKIQDRDLDLNESVTVELQTLYTPDNTTSIINDFTYSSDDEAIMTVSDNGITAIASPVGAGSANIEVMTNDPLNLTGSLSLTVKDTTQETDNWIPDTRRKSFVLTSSSYFGRDVSIYGNYAAATGAATGIKIYKKTTGVWSYLTTISDPTDEELKTVSVYEDYIITGVNTSDSFGKIYIYKNNGSDIFSEVGHFDGEAAGDYFGLNTLSWSNSTIQMDGNYLVVGCPSFSGNYGKVYIYKNAGGDSWSLVDSIAGSSGDYLGISVSISGDYIAITGYKYNGAIYIYKNDGDDTFSLVNSSLSYSNDSQLYYAGQRSLKILPGWISESDYYGVKIWSANEDYSEFTKVYDSYSSIPALAGGQAISDFNGDYLLIGNWNYGTGGGVYVLKRNISVFSQIAIVQAHDRASGNYFARNISLGPTGFDAIIGSPNVIIDASYRGKAYIYTVDPTLVTSLTVSNPGSDPDINGPTDTNLSISILPVDATNDQVTWSLSDETRAIISVAGKMTAKEAGSITVTATANDGSSVYDDLEITVRNSLGWKSNFTGYTLAAVASDYYFGQGVSADNNKVVFGVLYGGVSNNYYGGVKVYKLTKAGLELEQNLSGQDASIQGYRYWGDRNCIQGDNLIVGASNEVGAQDNDVVIYKFDSGSWTVKGHFYQPSGYSSAYGCAVAIYGNYAVVGDFGYLIDFGALGRIHVYKNDGSDNWSQLTTIDCPNPLYAGLPANFGYSVAMEGDYIVVGAPGWRYDTSGYNHGAIFLYKRDGSDNFNFKDCIRYNEAYVHAYFGYSVSIKDRFVAAGAHGGLSNGLVKIYKINNSDRLELIDSIVGASSGDQFGTRVSLSGRYLAVGSGNSATYGDTSIWRRGPNNKYEKVATYAGDSNWSGAYDCALAEGGSIAIIGNHAAWSINACKVKAFKVNIADVIISGSAITWCNSYTGSGSATLSGSAEIQFEDTDYIFRLAGGQMSFGGSATTSVE